MVGGREQANYIAVRNHILTRWRSHVSAWLTRGHALESIWAELKAMVDSAYNFLRQHGYINFGMAQWNKWESTCSSCKENGVAPT